MASVARALFTAALAAVGAGVVLHAIRPDAPFATKAPADPLDALNPDDVDADDLSPMQLRALLREFARMDGEDLDADSDADLAGFASLLDADDRRG